MSLDYLFNEGEYAIMEDGELYQIAKNVNYNNEEYVVIGKVSTSADTMIDDSDKMYLCKVIIENGEALLNPIEDEYLMQVILGLK